MMAPMIAEISLWTPAATTSAERTDRLFFAVAGICTAVGLLVAVLLIYYCVKYRRRPGTTGNPTATHASHALEWFWTLTPLAIFIVMYVWGADVYFEAYTSPPEATPVYVVGKQWMWKFQHLEGQREINTLHVPVGRPVKLLCISEDVIHSFFVPAFRVHLDLLPTRYTTTCLEVTRPGTYHLFCSQYCGTNHAGMIGTVIAQEPADYQRWLSQSAEGSLALRGRGLFLKYRCLSCHSADHNARAPVLEGVFGVPVVLSDGRTVVADENYLRESMLNPSAKIVAGYADVMPTFQGKLDEEKIVALIAFLRGLGPGETPRRVESFPVPEHTPPIE